jgi:hypothetical protein
MKDEDASLDSIAEAVSPSLGDSSVAAEDVVSQGIVSAAALELYREVHPGEDPLAFGQLLTAYVLDRLLQTGDVSLDEGRMLARGLEEKYAICEGKACDFVFVRKMGISTCFVVTSSAELAFESQTRAVARLSLSACIEELKTRIR